MHGPQRTKPVNYSCFSLQNACNNIGKQPNQVEKLLSCRILGMRAYCKPTKNRILCNFQFREMRQEPRKTFSTFCNQINKASEKNCHFSECTIDDCGSVEYALRNENAHGMHNKIHCDTAILILERLRLRSPTDEEM